MTLSSLARTVLAALCLAALFETTSGNLQADEPKGELAGVVVDLDGHPVANAKVWLETRPPATIASTARWQRSTASIRLRATAMSVVATCICTPKRSPSMPRGSRMPLPPSIA